MIHFLVPSQGAFSVEEYLTKEPPELSDRFQVIHYESLSGIAQFRRGTYVLSGLDQLEGTALQTVVGLVDQLSAADGVRVLNSPTRSLRRVELMNTLHARGRSDFRIWRPGDDLRGLRYPVYLRQERFHGGNISPLLHSRRELEQALGRAVLAGYPWRDILVVEFCPTANSAGVYRKYAAFKVGPSIMARSCYVGHQWMLKFDGSEFTEATVREEEEYVRSNPHREQLAEIFEIAAVEYGQIDYSMKDGRVQPWEINLNPTIGRTPGPSGGVGPKELWPIRNATREYFFDQFREAWARVDTSSEGPGIAAPIAAAIQVAPPHTKHSPVAEAIRAVLRPAKAILLPVAGPLLRVVPAAMRLRNRSRR